MLLEFSLVKSLLMMIFVWYKIIVIEEVLKQVLLFFFKVMGMNYFMMDVDKGLDCEIVCERMCNFVIEVVDFVLIVFFNFELIEFYWLFLFCCIGCDLESNDGML